MEPRLLVSESQYQKNLRALAERIAPAALLLVVKDDAYAHGLEWAAQGARRAGVEWFGSYGVPEGERLRAALGETPRILAWGPADEEETEAALRAGIDLGIGSVAQLRQTIGIAERIDVRARVHLKADTGLHRNGIRLEHWREAVQDARIAESRGTIVLSGIWSHLAEASDAEDDAARGAFDEALRVVAAAGADPEVTHLTASAASWWRPELRGSLCRIGAFCYGIRSAGGPVLEGIAPIATLVARVAESGPSGARVAIGGSHGLPSSLREFRVGTAAGPQRVARVDAHSAELPDWTDAEVGEEVWIFGPGQHGEQDATALAESIDTVGEEILTRLTPRVRRVYVG